MSTICRRIGLVALLAGYGLTFGLAPAQPPAPKAEPKSSDPEPVAPTEIQVLPLKHARASEAAQLLQQVFGAGQRGASVRVGIDERTNSLVVSGPVAKADEIKALIIQIDAPAAPAGKTARPELRVFALQALEADGAVENALRLAIGRNTNARYTLDPQRKQVMVYADEATMNVVEALLSRMDRPAPALPPRDVQVRVIWLVNGVPQEDAPPPPDDLKDTLPGLAKLGLDRPRLAAQALVNVTPHASFSAQGVAKLDGPCQFVVTGEYSDKKDGPVLRLNIRAARRQNPGPSEDVCNLQTEISAPPGHFVVLGMTPTGAMTSVFVVQVRPQEARPAPRR
jgi:hypothetical protein